MIINPSAHTVIPRNNSFNRCSQRRVRQAMSIPGGKQFWYAATRIMVAATLVLFVTSLWFGKSVTEVNQKIEMVAVEHEELVNANILLRAQKAHLFSPEAVGALAANQLAIHVPRSGQYMKF